MFDLFVTDVWCVFIHLAVFVHVHACCNELKHDGSDMALKS